MQENKPKDELNKGVFLEAFGASDAPALFLFDELDSTNTEAKRMVALNSPTPAIIVAGRQTAGRGRLGRSFYSPDETGAYFSILYRAAAPLCDAVRVTSAASAALMRAIRSLCGIQTEIKWVNDLYLDGKKIAGILTEAVTSPDGETYIIVGIGVNLSTQTFPEELADKAGSLGRSVTRASLIAQAWKELAPYFDDPSDRSWLEDYRRHSCVIGKVITWIEGDREQSGVAEAIDADGALLVRSDDGTRTRLATGEISIKMESANGGMKCEFS